MILYNQRLRLAGCKPSCKFSVCVFPKAVNPSLRTRRGRGRGSGSSAGRLRRLFIGERRRLKLVFNCWSLLQVIVGSFLWRVEKALGLGRWEPLWVTWRDRPARMGLAQAPRLKMSLGGSTWRSSQSWSQVGVNYQQLHVPRFVPNGEILHGYLLRVHPEFHTDFQVGLVVRIFWAGSSICNTEWRLITKASAFTDLSPFSFIFYILLG